MSESDNRSWARAQAVSGLVFGVFLAIHLGNLVLAASGVGTYDAVQEAIRPAYQFPVVEIVLLGALLLHMAAGARALWRRRGKKAPVKDPGLRWHRRAGLFLLIFVLGHITATRGIELIFGVAAKASGIAFSLHFVPAWFYPYYTALAVAGLYHGVFGGLRALRVIGASAPVARGKVFWGVVAVGAVAVTLGVLGLAGVLYEIPDPMQNPYADVYRDLGVVPTP